MNFMFLLVALSLISKASSQIALVDFYYQSLDPSSRAYFVEQLLPAVKFFGPHIHIFTVPLTNLKPDGSFECKNGPDECLLNLVQACVQFDDSAKTISFMNCTTQNDILNVNDTITKCIASNLLNKDNIDACVVTFGLNFMASYSWQIEQLNLKQLPAVKLFQEFVDTNVNLVKFICTNKFVGPKLPPCQYTVDTTPVSDYDTAYEISDVLGNSEEFLERSKRSANRKLIKKTPVEFLDDNSTTMAPSQNETSSQQDETFEYLIVPNSNNVSADNNQYPVTREPQDEFSNNSSNNSFQEDIVNATAQPNDIESDGTTMTPSKNETSQQDPFSNLDFPISNSSSSNNNQSSELQDDEIPNNSSKPQSEIFFQQDNGTTPIGPPGSNGVSFKSTDATFIIIKETSNSTESPPQSGSNITEAEMQYTLQPSTSDSDNLIEPNSDDI